jgi:hypothetical protein
MGDCASEIKTKLPFEQSEKRRLKTEITPSSSELDVPRVTEDM